MNTYEKAVAFLPEGLQRSLLRIPTAQQERVQEIRLRRNGLLLLSMAEGALTVDTTGVLSEKPSPRTVYCTVADIEKTFLKACEYSVHSHSEELKEGFITAKGGFRIGVAGTAVTEHGQVVAVRDIRSLCLRIARRHDGCAVGLAPLFFQRIPSLLIAGAPASGKTSILRDTARMLCEGINGRRFRVCVVDERGEIAGAGGLENADILTSVPKHTGILQAVRTLAPDVILSDELGTVEEVEAVAETLRAGVPVITTVHCRDLKEALCRPAVRLAVERRLFDKLVFLRGREAPGRVRDIMEVDTVEMDRRGDADGGGRVHWHGARATTPPAVETVARDTCMVTRF